MAKKKKKAQSTEEELSTQLEQLPQKKQKKQKKEKKEKQRDGYGILLPFLTVLLVLVGIFDVLIWSYIGIRMIFT